MRLLQGSGQVLLGLAPGAAVGFAGEENAVPVALEGFAQIGLAAGVSPGALKVRDAGFQGRLDHGPGLALVAKGAEHPFAPQAQNGDGTAGASQGRLGDGHGISKPFRHGWLLILGWSIGKINEKCWEYPDLTPPAGLLS